MKHLNKLVFLSLACYLSSCDAPPSNQTHDTTAEVAAAPTTDKEIDAVANEARAAVDSIANEAGTPATKKHKHYASVIEMIEESGDFTQENGSMKVISKSPLHIQISSAAGNIDDLEQMKRNAMQELIYIAYASFTMTDIPQITITTVPYDAAQFIDHQKMVFQKAASTTITISREKARRVMQARLSTSNFDDMFGVQVGQQYFAESPSPLLEKLRATFPIEKVIDQLKS
ncbi:hypothetical protein SIO70_01505 [Chitinophaga sancti]|uniref:hypothetical protein n=1 Tax=Chitinophaga sancti TaxID=1004 RepID=UPI002A751063|nr:hypothetical protein [Chitinophaga sancti]WPQ63540.1 hypothetical protein SIO70_01505 [Chitinophaga sancti]